MYSYLLITALIVVFTCESLMENFCKSLFPN